VVLSAVGAERAILHPNDVAIYAEMASVSGGLALFLVGNGLFKWQSGRYFPLSRIVGLVLAAALVGVGPVTDLVTVNLAAAAVLIVVAVWEHISLST
jgi:low temperature requirement protein LtrA